MATIYRAILPLRTTSPRLSMCSITQTHKQTHRKHTHVDSWTHVRRYTSKHTGNTHTLIVEHTYADTEANTQETHAHTLIVGHTYADTQANTRTHADSWTHVRRHPIKHTGNTHTLIVGHTYADTQANTPETHTR